MLQNNPALSSWSSEQHLKTTAENSGYWLVEINMFEFSSCSSNKHKPAVRDSEKHEHTQSGSTTKYQYRAKVTTGVNKSSVSVCQLNCIT